MKTDFHSDLDKALSRFFEENGFQTIAKDQIRIVKYLDVLRRVPSATKRIVRLSPVITIPERRAKGFRELVAALEGGENLFPYLSKGILHPGKNDALFNDWNIVHFHLGEIRDGQRFSDRTGELAFVYFSGQVAFVCHIGDHDSFTDYLLIETLHKYWPEELSKFELKGVHPGTGGNDPETLRIYREKNITGTVTFDGKAYIGPGFGSMMGGVGVRSFMDYQGLLQKLRGWESIAKTTFKSIYSGGNFKDWEENQISLEMNENGQAFAVDGKTGLTMYLGIV